ncbi:MAG: carboxymuconolactone decarboxylase family protein [Pseudomonadota bacterium]
MIENRITPMVREELSDEAREILDLWSGGRKEPKNIFKVYFKNELLNNNWSVMAGHLFFKNSLTSRQREIIVLRITWRCRSDYEFINHLEIARNRKLMSEDEMLDLTRDTTQLAWNREETALISATNEIAETTEMSDETWGILNETLSIPQIMDVVMTVGGYTLNSMACNSLTVDIDTEHSRDPGLTPSAEGPVAIKRTVSKTGASPRVPIAELTSLDGDVAQKVNGALGATSERNRVLTLAHHPLLLEDWAPISAYVEDKSNLTSSEADLIMLRAFWRYGVVYGFTHAAHHAVARGLEQDLVDDIPVGSGSSAFDARQKLLLRAVDQLVDGIFIQDDLWTQLREHYSELELMDVVFTTGNSYIKSIFLKTFRVQLESGVSAHTAFKN